MVLIVLWNHSVPRTILSSALSLSTSESMVSDINLVFQEKVKVFLAYNVNVT